MSTRCSIRINGGDVEYRIYRHHDGYPKGVISDIKQMVENYSRNMLYDPEYWLANFIFYAKLSWYLEDEGDMKKRSWENGYGVCSPDCVHVMKMDRDWEYIYTIYKKKDEAWIKIEHVYTGEEEEMPLDEAIRRWGDAFPDGCHISKKIFEQEVSQ